MDSLFIVKSSAFEIYRHLRSTGQMRKLSPMSGKLPTPTTRPDAAFDSLLISSTITEKPLDLMIKNKAQCHTSKSCNFHLYEKSFPAGSFLRLENQIYLSSPELTFCTLANSLSLVQLILYGLELCGTYAISHSTDEVKYDLREISTAEEINQYGKRLKKTYPRFSGINNATQAANILENNSASPQESRLFIVLSAPRNIGGYQISNIKLNQEISLTKSAKEIAHQNIIKSDMVIKKNKIVIEYDSNQFHDNTGQNIKDKNRLNALKHDG